MKNKRLFIILSLLTTILLTISGCGSDFSLPKGFWSNLPAESEETDSEDVTMPTASSSSDKENTARNTIMIYIVGSDLESEYGNATVDMEEMQDAGIDTDVNNIIVYTGGASKWKMRGLSSKENAILRLEDDEFDIVSTTKAYNMGDADTLSTFINYCLDNYPADQYGLILWNHGAGPVMGFGVDENYEDLLNLTELQDAMANSFGTAKQRLEWVGFDACLMNSMEVADIFAPYANYMIASQETEPGWGWNYDFLSELSNPNMDGADIGKAIISYYMGYGERVFDAYPKYYTDLTLSCIDLKQYQASEEALNNFFAEMDSSLSVDTYPTLARKREKLRGFGSYSSTFDYCMVDAVRLLENFSGDSKSARQAISAIKNMVVYSDSNMDNACGISLCYPYNIKKSYMEECVYVQEQIGFAPNYTHFLNNFFAIATGKPLSKSWQIDSSDVTIETQVDENGSTSDITLALTEEQQETFSSAGYMILCNVGSKGWLIYEENPRADETYLFVYTSNDVQLDDAGILHAKYQDNALYLRDCTTGELSELPILNLREQEIINDEKRYTTDAVLHDYDRDKGWAIDTVELQIVINDEYPNGIIRSAIPLNTDENDSILHPDKQLLDLADYDTISFVSRCSYVTRDDTGNMLQFFDWKESGIMMGFEQDLSHEYALELCPVQDPENYACMFYIKDVQGNISYSELIPLID